MDESVSEVVLIGVDETALQGMYDHPAGAKEGALLLPAKGRDRHDRALKRLHNRLVASGVAVLIAELVDESEGWHRFGSAEFFTQRAEAVLLWWHQREEKLPVAVFASGFDTEAAQRLLSYDWVRSVVIGDGEGYLLCSRSGQQAVADPFVADLWQKAR